MKTYNLIDYKGKFTIIEDKENFNENSIHDVIVGEITHEDAIKEAPERVESAIYYGVPAILTKDKELNEVYDKLYEKETK